MQFRSATPSDWSGILTLYNHYVEHSPATFDLTPFTVESRRPWFEAFQLDGPYQLLVAEDCGCVVGYVSSSRFHPKPAYASSAESSVYVRADFTGQGVGSGLYSALLERLQKEGLHRLYAGITLPNPASLKLHAKFGFNKAALYREVGHKFGRYWDVTWLEREL